MTDYNALPAHSAWAYIEDADRKRREIIIACYR